MREDRGVAHVQKEKIDLDQTLMAVSVFGLSRFYYYIKRIPLSLANLKDSMTCFPNLDKRKSHAASVPTIERFHDFVRDFPELLSYQSVITDWQISKASLSFSQLA